MIKLQQVISAIFRDITKAKIIADAHSGKMAESYKENDMLSLLSIPDIHLSEVEIELKFAIADVSLDKDDDNNKIIQDIVESYSEEIVITLTKSILNTISKLEGLNKPEFLSQDLSQKLHYTDSITNLHADLIHSFKAQPENFSGIVEQVDKEVKDLNEIIVQLKGIAQMSLARQALEQKLFSADFKDIIKTELIDYLKTQEPVLRDVNSESSKQIVLTGIYSILDKNIFNYTELDQYIETLLGCFLNEKTGKNQRRKKRQTTIIQEIRKSIELEIENLLSNILSKIEAIAESDDDYTVSVYVTNEKLAEIPESAISSIKIKTEKNNDSFPYSE
ncbi:hypothetical protein [Coleofasciculus sp.]|uniref:hypothetical protein n=1 Tax=Coleofasciculus sp. TaxID=3100458 RepID=UPI0039F7A9E4